MPTLQTRVVESVHMADTSLTIGDIQLTTVSGGTLWIDGGNMFGVVPRGMWERFSPPDTQNRILLDTTCLLVQTPDSIGLIDTGYGSKASQKKRQRHQMQDGSPLVENLAAQGIRPEQIDWVILTHLHFDHAGGATQRDTDQRFRPVFSNARHVISTIEWEDATSGRPELAGAYDEQDFLPLKDANLLTLVDDGDEIKPGITVHRTNGHTRGHQLVRLNSGGRTAVYVGDVCPQAAHVRAFWTMSYDQYPLTTRQTKPKILGEIADNGHTIVFPHDPKIRFARLTRSDTAEFLVEPWSEI